MDFPKTIGGNQLMKRMCFAIMLSLVLSACGQETSSGSYAIIIVVNDNEYNGADSDLEDYEPDKMIGSITKEVPVDVFPANNQSNFFEEGTVIFSVKGETDVVIAENPKGDRYLMHYAPGNDSK